MGASGQEAGVHGAEFAQEREWNHDGALDRALAGDPLHGGVQRLLGDLNRLYRDHPALHARDSEPAGFDWVVGDDAENAVFAFLRRGDGDGLPVLVVANMTPLPRAGYRIGVPLGGRWREVLNSDAGIYGGSGMGNHGAADCVDIPSHGHAQSLELTLPPWPCSTCNPRGVSDLAEPTSRLQPGTPIRSAPPGMASA